MWRGEVGKQGQLEKCSLWEGSQQKRQKPCLEGPGCHAGWEVWVGPGGGNSLLRVDRPIKRESGWRFSGRCGRRREVMGRLKALRRGV